MMADHSAHITRRGRFNYVVVLGVGQAETVVSRLTRWGAMRTCARHMRATHNGGFDG